MNCSTFKKNLDRLIEGELPSDFSKSMGEHMEGCKECRHSYEEEVELQALFKQSISFEDVNFKSSRTEIIDSIDKDLYKKDGIRKVGFHFMRNRRKYSLAAAAIVVITMMPLAKEFLYTKSMDLVKTTMDKNKTLDKTDNKSNYVSDDKSLTMKGAGILQIGQYDTVYFIKKEVEEQKFPQATPFKDSSNKAIEAAIDGKGEKALEEGIGSVLIREKTIGKTFRYSIGNLANKQLSPLYIEWFDNDNLLVIVGVGYGTVAKGGNVYMLNVKNNTTTLVYGTSSKLEQVKSVKIESGKITLDIAKYKDDSLNKYSTYTKSINYVVQTDEVLLSSTNKRYDEFSLLSEYVRSLNKDSGRLIKDLTVDDYIEEGQFDIESTSGANELYLKKIILFGDDSITKYFKSLGFYDVTACGLEIMQEGNSHTFYKLAIIVRTDKTSNYKILYVYNPPQR